MKADEYLEAVVKDAFERELEVSENVARTLPFFAASFAVAVPLYGYIAARLPPFEREPLSLALHALLGLGAWCGVMILWNLFLMVRLREYRIPPKETAQVDWMQALKAHYASQGLTAATVDRKVTQHLRDRMLLEYAAGAEHNREANTPKLRARASGVVFFVAMLVIAFAMIGLIFVSQRLPQRPCQDAAHVATQAEARRPAEVGCRPASAAQAAGSAIGSEVPRGAGGQYGAGSGSQVSEAAKTGGNPGPSPAPSQPAPSQPTTAQPASEPPAPPPHQLLKNNNAGGERR